MLERHSEVEIGLATMSLEIPLTPVVLSREVIAVLRRSAERTRLVCSTGGRWRERRNIYSSTLF